MSPAVRPASVAASRTTLTSSATSCECRINEPAAPPASGNRSHSVSEDRDEPVYGELFALVVTTDRFPTSPDRSPPPNASPPDYPLYLRTSRFLI
jgi:hypothetical protein